MSPNWPLIFYLGLQNEVYIVAADISRSQLALVVTLLDQLSFIISMQHRGSNPGLPRSIIAFPRANDGARTSFVNQGFSHCLKYLLKNPSVVRLVDLKVTRQL